MGQKRDDAIQRDVLRELDWDARVTATDVGVAVRDGVVTLTGTVSSYGERLAAQEAAHRVGGVLDVANDLHVKLPSADARDDTDIARAVRRTLEWHVQVPHERIQSTVSDGRVTLTGTVDFAHQREIAEWAVRNLTGVCAVTNRIELAVERVDAEVVREAIEEALERRAERELRRIAVAVHDGTVTLTGTVTSYPEKVAVLGAARYTRGVHAVEDRLRIGPAA
jgi:osmotically-inducible protein OsmY